MIQVMIVQLVCFFVFGATTHYANYQRITKTGAPPIMRNLCSSYAFLLMLANVNQRSARDRKKKNDTVAKQTKCDDKPRRRQTNISQEIMFNEHVFKTHALTFMNECTYK